MSILRLTASLISWKVFTYSFRKVQTLLQSLIPNIFLTIALTPARPNKMVVGQTVLVLFLKRSGMEPPVVRGTPIGIKDALFVESWGTQRKRVGCAAKKKFQALTWI